MESEASYLRGEKYSMWTYNKGEQEILLFLGKYGK